MLDGLNRLGVGQLGAYLVWIQDVAGSSPATQIFDGLLVGCS